MYGGSAGGVRVWSGQVTASPVLVLWRSGWGPGHDPPVSDESGATPTAHTGYSPEHLPKEMKSYNDS